MNTRAPTTAATTATAVTTFWPTVKPEENRRTPSFIRVRSLTGTSATRSSEGHGHDVVVRLHGLVDEGGRDLRVEGGLAGGDHRVGQVPLARRRLRLGAGRGALRLLELVDGVPHLVGERVRADGTGGGRPGRRPGGGGGRDR